MASGSEIVAHAAGKIGQKYVLGASVPLNDPDYDGPWDCAELCSWAVFQAARIIYGCTRNDANPGVADAWTKSWKRDMETLGYEIPVNDARFIPGAMLLRRSETAGHIAISRGDGETTVEAKGRREGVISGKILGRSWQWGVLVPGIEYDSVSSLSAQEAVYTQPPVLKVDAGITEYRESVRAVQSRLSELGYMEPTEVTGVFGLATELAVLQFQRWSGITPDGEVSMETVRELGLESSVLTLGQE